MAEPKAVGGGVWIVALVCARAVDSGRIFLLLGCVTGTSVGRNIGLGGAASLSMVVIYGVLKVDFFCYLFFGDCCILAGHLGSCGGFPTCRAGGTFQMYCGIGRLGWRTSGLYCC